MLNNKPDVTVLLPCYNEEEALAKVVGDIRTALDGTKYSYEILVVDDGSTDKSASIAESLACRVVRHTVRRGSGASRKTGILAAQGNIVAMLDADATYTAMDIPKMLDYFPDFDQVNGARTSEQGTLLVLRSLTKRLIRTFINLLTNQKIPDLNTGLKAFKRDIMLRYLWMIPDGFSCVTTMTMAFLANGHRVKYIPTEYHKRIGLSKFNPTKDTYKHLRGVLRLLMYFYPFRAFFNGASFVLIGAGVLRLLYDFYFFSNHFQISDMLLIIGGIAAGACARLFDRPDTNNKTRYDTKNQMGVL
jgi:polyisoprenyl-phosphate glycosyltransferase